MAERYFSPFPDSSLPDQWIQKVSAGLDRLRNGPVPTGADVLAAMQALYGNCVDHSGEGFESVHYSIRPVYEVNGSIPKQAGCKATIRRPHPNGGYDITTIIFTAPDQLKAGIGHGTYDQMNKCWTDEPLAFANIPATSRDPLSPLYRQAYQDLHSIIPDLMSPQTS